jgi:hypothetical protein
MNIKNIIWASVYGSYISLQCRDYMRSGYGAPTDQDMERFIEEAESIADFEQEMHKKLYDK